MTYELFLTHADSDSGAASALARWLEDLFSVRVFASSILPGQHFHSRITDGLRECKAALLLASPSSLSRPWVNYEAGAVNALGKPLIPICVGGIRKSELPTTIGHLQACEYDSERDVTNMLNAIASYLGLDAIRSSGLLASVPERPKLASLLGPPVAPEPAEVIRNRTTAMSTAVQRMIDTAVNKNQCLYFLGLSNSYLFGANPDLEQQLEHALSRGAKAKLIFLDPDSPAAARRRMHERGRLDTVDEIRTKIKVAEKHARKLPGQITLQLTPDVSCFLCFNDEEVVIHPYLNSVTGHEMPILWATSGSHLYRWSREHFDKVWGQTRYFLFDLGNVLIDFDHRIVSQRLLEYFPRNRRNAVLQEQLQRFIFTDGGCNSLNSQLDRGKRDLVWLSNEVRKQFRLNFSDSDFAEIWASIFSPTLNELPIACMSHFREKGLGVAICSNTNREHWTGLLKKHELLQDLSKEIPCFLSFEIGKIKTDDGFFIGREVGPSIELMPNMGYYADSSPMLISLHAALLCMKCSDLGVAEPERLNPA